MIRLLHRPFLAIETHAHPMALDVIPGDLGQALMGRLLGMWLFALHTICPVNGMVRTLVARLPLQVRLI